MLTSLGENDLRETGVAAGPEAQVVRLARLAVECGLGGLVCSPLEIAPLRAQLPPAIKLVTPGIRPAGAGGGDDQARVMTPAEAARAGANFIVVGRPIFKAPDPVAAAAGHPRRTRRPASFAMAGPSSRLSPRASASGGGFSPLPMSRTAAILLAAGQGRRMQGAVADKILAPLAGRPVFAHSAAAFVASGVADFYVIVYRDPRQSLELSCYAPTPALFVQGGRERQDSVANALAGAARRTSTTSSSTTAPGRSSAPSSSSPCSRWCAATAPSCWPTA